jgi:hypothetical protein
MGNEIDPKPTETEKSPETAPAAQVTPDLRTPKERSLANLKPFTHTYRPKRPGHPPGLENRSSAYVREHGLEAPEKLIGFVKTNFPKVRGKITVFRAGVLRDYMEWIGGDVQAGKEIKDSIFGKSQENIKHSGSISRGTEDLTDDDLDRLIEDLDRRAADASPGEGKAPV